ncbi:MAG: hypothetical protein IKA85_00615 [Clostridia bacterium]|nr:hypothetical protein [Clostridia bacterium]
MIDIHSHILPNVDDGSDSLKTSLALVIDEIKNDVDKIILTPHNKSGRYDMPKEELIKRFNAFKGEVENNNLNVKLYLGQEVYVCDEFYKKLENSELLTINDTKYLFIEFNYYMETDIVKHVASIIKRGYVPVIAHVERYEYLDWHILYDLKMMGALIQINSSCFIGNKNKRLYQNAINAISENCVDFIASDIHAKRKTYFKKAYKKISKIFGKEVADNLFTNNAEKYFNLI